MATGWKIGRETGPCGKVKMEALALVVYTEKGKGDVSPLDCQTAGTVRREIGVLIGHEIWTKTNRTFGNDLESECRRFKSRRHRPQHTATLCNDGQ